MCIRDRSLSACEVYGMRLAPGRTYLRYGCVLDLKTVPGRIDALAVSYTHLDVYKRQLQRKLPIL